MSHEWGRLRAQEGVFVTLKFARLVFRVVSVLTWESPDGRVTGAWNVGRHSLVMGLGGCIKW